MTTLRAAMPLSAEEILAVFGFAAREVARLHESGWTHGALTIDDIGVRRLVTGEVEVTLAAAVGGVARHDDVAALGAALAAAVHRCPEAPPNGGDLLPRLGEIAAAARRSALGGTTTAADVASTLEALGPTATTTPRAPAASGARLRLAAWIAVLLATVVLLPRVAGHVSAPPLTAGWTAFTEWAATRDLATAVVGVLRLGVQSLAGYLLASTLLTAALHLLPSAAAHRLAFVEALTAVSTRRLVAAAFGLSLTVGAMATIRVGPTRPAPGAAPAATTTAPVTAQPPATTTTDLATEPSAEAATPAPAPAAALGAPPAVGAAGPAGASAGSEPERTWTVRPGDHFWNIAERIVAEGGAGAGEAAVRAYWSTLVEANRDRLVVSDDPDLLLPDQVLRLPPPA